jgi:hypothetical protein
MEAAARFDTPLTSAAQHGEGWRTAMPRLPEQPLSLAQARVEGRTTFSEQEIKT